MVIYATYAVNMTICFLKNKYKTELELFCGRYKIVTGSALAAILKLKGHCLE